MPSDDAPAHAGPVLRIEPFTSPAARTLIAQADLFNESLYGHADQSPIDPHQFDVEAGGQFIVAYLDNEPVGCGGLRKAESPAPTDAGEIKRMFVVEHARRRGLARRILAALEEAARGYGYSQVVLDTGSKQDAAHCLYESAGYHRIPGFTIYRDRPGNRAYAKSLA
ncbi:MAG: GNAT family N-acetyltransferase [Micromonosporaceae bacterium]|nr:GNAT family N-acetyltransferase [Micromonosporaceae bacterium]